MSSNAPAEPRPEDASAAIVARGISKCYHIYDRPQDRLRQALMPRLQRLAGRPQKRYFRDFWALNDVSVDVPRGGTVGIIGRNGSGKSTLLQIICGTLSPTSGNVAVEGRVAALLELGSGFNMEFTGRENVFLNGMLLGLTREQVEQRFDSIAAFADIGAFIEQPVKTYSSGMILRLAFAVVAHVDADILVIDEAMSVGDAVFTQKCMRFLRGFMRTGTVLFVSHDAASVLSLCTSAIWIDAGRVRMSGPAKAVAEAYLAFCTEAVQGEEHAMRATGALPHDEAPATTHASDEATTIGFFDNIAHSEGWSTDAAEIVSVWLERLDGKTAASYAGGERVVLHVRAVAHRALASPIIGFLVKDRLGQALFGENTFIDGETVAAREGETLEAGFRFALPMLPNGDYSMTVAIADGDPAVHVQHHWLHDAVLIKVASTRRRHGLVGIPFEAVTLRAEAPPAPSALAAE